MNGSKPILEYMRPTRAILPPPPGRRPSLSKSLCVIALLLAASAVVTPAVWFTFRALGWVLSRL